MYCLNAYDDCENVCFLYMPVMLVSMDVFCECL